MNKYFGQIGFAVTQETSPGVWTDAVVERDYFGDILRNYRRFEGNTIDDNIDISNRISIVADPYAYENFHNMTYIRFMGTEWKIESIEVQYPRLILQIGGVYNGQVAARSSS